MPVPSLILDLVLQSPATQQLSGVPFGVAPIVSDPGDFQDQLRRLLAGAQIAGLGLTMLAGLPQAAPVKADAPQPIEGATAAVSAPPTSTTIGPAAATLPIVVSTTDVEATLPLATAVTQVLPTAAVAAGDRTSPQNAVLVQAATSGGQALDPLPEADNSGSSTPSASQSERSRNAKVVPQSDGPQAESKSRIAVVALPATNAAVLLTSPFNPNPSIPTDSAATTTPTVASRTELRSTPGAETVGTPPPFGVEPDAQDAVAGHASALSSDSTPASAAVIDSPFPLPITPSADHYDTVSTPPEPEVTVPESSGSSAVSAVESPVPAPTVALLPDGQYGLNFTASNVSELPTNAGHAEPAAIVTPTSAVLTVAPTTVDRRLDRGLGGVEANNWLQSVDRVSTILPTAVKAAPRIREHETLAWDSGLSANTVATDVAAVANLTTSDYTGSAALNSTALPSDQSAGGGSLVQQVSHAIEAWRGSLAEHGTARFAAWLTPPNLGQVWVELTRSSGGITARISASDDSVQALLNAQSPGLRQALAESGINITALDVSGRSGGDATSQRQQQQSDQRAEQESLPPLRFTVSARRTLAANPGVVDVRV